VGIWRELKNRPQLERLARSFEHTGDVGHALALWQELAEVEQIRALAWRALNAQDLDHAGAALEILEGLAREDPQLDALYLRLAENYTAVGDHSKARLYLQHVLTRKP
jgi:tetratricopeptide (TPR) repeat protein